MCGKYQARAIKGMSDLIQDRIKKLSLTLDAYIEEIVSKCEHKLEDIRELPYKSDVFETKFPWLICMNCGYTEEGWGCGYKKLKFAEYEKVPKITSNEWCQYRTICVSQGRHRQED